MLEEAMKKTATQSAALKQALKKDPVTDELRAEAEAFPLEADEACAEVREARDFCTPDSWVAEQVEHGEWEHGWFSITELVSDGHMTWFETQRYLYYSPEEARELFLEHVKQNNWTIKEEA